MGKSAEAYTTGWGVSTCLGFRVQGSGCRVQGSGFRVQGSGSRVQGSGFRICLGEEVGVAGESREGLDALLDVECWVEQLHLLDHHCRHECESFAWSIGGRI